jgi:gliding motility-associated-like protein
MRRKVIFFFNTIAALFFSPLGRTGGATSSHRAIGITFLSVVLFFLSVSKSKAGGCETADFTVTMNYDFCNTSFCMDIAINATGLHGNDQFTIDFGDGTTFDTIVVAQISTLTGICHKYASPGTYIITLAISPAHTTCLVQKQVTFGYYPSVTNVSCAGGNSGAITYNIGGGTPPFTYQWSNGGTTPTVTGLAPGNYTVTVTDGNGCTLVDTIPVNDYSFDLDLTGSCLSGNGSVTVVRDTSVKFPPDTVYYEPFTLPNGTTTGPGTPPRWTISGDLDWTSWQVNNNMWWGNNVDQQATWSTLCMDLSACAGQPILYIDISTGPGQPDDLDYFEVYYNYNSTGEVLLFKKIGSNNAGDLPYYPNFASFKYPIPVGPGGCVQIIIKVKMESLSEYYYFDNVRVECAPKHSYKYLWCNGDTTPTTTNLPGSGQCIVTVTDENGCTASDTVFCCSIALTPSSTNILCAGQNNGTATVTPSSGASPYTYSWNTTPVRTTQSITGLSPGSYKVVVTDNGGCVDSLTITITEPPPLVPVVNVTNVRCAGQCNGSATVSVSGGISPYTYSWNTTPPQTGTTATGLCASNYTVTIRDANNCTITATAVITEPPPLVLGTSGTNPTCSPTGSVTVTASGGTSPYTYQWTPSGGTSSTATGLSAGTYCVTVTDLNGCTQTACTTLTAPVTFTLNTVLTHVRCNGGNDGCLDLSVTGGTSPFTYSWSNGTTSQDICTLTAGNYTVSVTDANGCSATASATINQPPPLSAPVNVTPARCAGSCDGTATVTAGGGTPGYTFSWNTTPSQTTNAASGLCAGTYTVTVTDANGCTITSTAVITEPPPIVLGISGADPACTPDGSATVTASGGTPGYSYQWSPSGGTSPIATGLAAGTWCVTVTDQNSCVQDTCITLTPPNTFTLNTVVTHVKCTGGNDGCIDLTVNGGNSPFTYSWSNGSSTQDICTLTAGTYNVTVTDSMGCVVIATAIVNQPAPLVPVVTVTNVSCPGACDGTATVTVTGGTSPYTYLWSQGSAATAATGLCPGTFTVTITDNNLCTVTATVVITEPPPLVLATTKTDAVCPGACDGTATVTAGGANGGYTYSWSTSPPQSTFSVTGLCVGSYTVTVTDSLGCNDTAIVIIAEPPPIVLNTSFTNPTCAPDGSATVVASGGNGSYSYLWNTVPSQTDSVATGLAPGTYTVVVTDSKGCTATVSVTLSPPGTFTLSTTLTHVRCFGGNDGAIDLTVNGGTAPFSYLWMPGPFSTQDISALTAGVYTVSVIDSNGCVAVRMDTIIQPPPLTISTQSTNPSCTAGGTATVTVSGGTTTYNYLWSDGQTTPVAAGLGAQVYTITVTDANGCTITDTVNLLNPSLPVADFTYVPGCFGTATPFTDNSTPGAGDPIVSWRWDFGNPSSGANNSSSLQHPSHLFDSAGTFYVTLIITTNNGCVDTITKPIEVWHIPVVIFGPPQNGCKPVCVDFMDSSTVIGGTISQWLWNFGDSLSTNNSSTKKNDRHCYENEGSYSVTLTVTSDKGCVNTLTRSNIINVYGYPKADFTMDPTETEILFPLIQFYDQSSGSPVRWRWDFGVPGISTDTDTIPNPSYSYPDTGTFNVCLTVYNGYGCPDSICRPVVIKPMWTFYIPNAFTPDDDGVNDFFNGKGYNIIEYQLWIFDRWGDMVYTTGVTVNPESSVPWDGRVNAKSPGAGMPAQEDVYVWVVKFKDIFNRRHRYIGHVTLVR